MVWSFILFHFFFSCFYWEIRGWEIPSTAVNTPKFKFYLIFLNIGFSGIFKRNVLLTSENLQTIEQRGTVCCLIRYTVYSRCNPTPLWIWSEIQVSSCLSSSCDYCLEKLWLERSKALQEMINNSLSSVLSGF